MDISVQPVQSLSHFQPQLPFRPNTIVNYDTPYGFTQVVDQLEVCLQSPADADWAETLVYLYQLIKNFKNEKPREGGLLNETMKQMLPKLYQQCVQQLPDQTEPSVLLQKQILKIYFSYTEHTLYTKIITTEIFSKWMELVWIIVDRPVPEHTLAVAEKYRARLPWWKCKKWGLRIMCNMFKNYGSPGNVVKEYTGFSLWYLKTFSAGILRVLLKILDQYKRKIYISPPVLELTLNYLGEGVGYFLLWKLLKPHMPDIVQDVLFPLLSYSKEYEELWNTDPREYIKVNLCKKLKAPVVSAENLLYACCQRRDGMLEQTMNFLINILNSPNINPSQKDGAFHMIGVLADLLLLTKMYRDLLNNIICRYVFPEFSSPCGHLKVRACWLLQHCSMISFAQEGNLAEAVQLIINSLLTNQELPVKFEASIALTVFINVQDKARKYLEPYVNRIILELLDIICVGKIDVTNMLYDIMHMYKDQLVPYGVEMCQYLAMKFCQGCNSNAISKCILKTFETQLTVMKNYPAILTQIQPIVLNVIGNIFTRNNSDFYELALCLVDNLTYKTVPSSMWKVLEHIYQLFQKDGLDYFPYMMPVLYNYITVDTNAFLSNENHMLAVFNICKSVLTGDTEEELECHAAKLLEVIILQCTGHIDHCILSFVELALQRLMRPVKKIELRTMCLQVVIAALYYNTKLLFNTLELLQLAAVDFFQQWIDDVCYFSSLHDCKMCVLGFCSVLNVAEQYTHILETVNPQIVPSLVVLYDRMKQIHECKALEEKEDGSDKEKVEVDPEFISNSEGDLGEIRLLLHRLDKAEKVRDRLKQRLFSKKPDEERSEFLRKHDLESYKTNIDEINCTVDAYIVFSDIFQNIRYHNSNFYAMLTNNLTMKEWQTLHEVLMVGDIRLRAAESK